MAALEAVVQGKKRLILVTLHRREEEETMRSVYEAIEASRCPGYTFVVPLHPNRIAAAAPKEVCARDARFLCVPPQGYAETQWLLKMSEFILTDSGGLQEESTWYGVPTVVFRRKTERPEAAIAGLSLLTGHDAATI